MDDPGDGPPVAAIPERVDRRLRLGPFSSARDALRFVTYAAVSAAVVPFTGAGLWLVAVATAFAACVVRTDGQALDERAFAYLHWRLGRDPGVRMVIPPTLRAGLRLGFVPAPDGRPGAIVRAGGTPITYLPPSDLARRFDTFRTVLRSFDGDLGLWITTTPMAVALVRLPPPGAPGPDAAARATYAELVEMICRRRRVRQVYLTLVAAGAGRDGRDDLDRRSEGLADRLGECGIAATRLRDGRLFDAARRVGWT
ncbi:MAG TPA: hypothetical protein VMC82_01800 [Thermoplasmata archaeon]|nr:hypothetical protein [Thermoplasmata archaeon]